MAQAQIPATPDVGDAPTTEHLYKEGKYLLRPVKPMSRSEFDAARRGYGATVCWSSDVAAAVSWAATFGLVLEVVR
ncbi:Uncharacterised protein [Mycobacteroides abscessus subsp. abscessus]|uniref:hypothetical protein n=1 Tax=Mycobacteroides abscessus TaxID=36809 RepID=UPI0009A76623|nr:hypothetical protein [Mycobacteroides abscessus]SKM36341.1 Uncharacterised protein [Mycobacteroides abscessus subsp. abscessus]